MDDFTGLFLVFLAGAILLNSCQSNDSTARIEKMLTEKCSAQTEQNSTDD